MPIDAAYKLRIGTGVSASVCAVDAPPSAVANGHSKVQGVDGNYWNVLVLDRTSVHRPWIDRVMSRCSARPCWFSGTIGSETWDSCCRVLLIALPNYLSEKEPLIDAIHSLKQQGFNLIAFGQGIETWPLRDRCRLLLAGISHLLDSIHSNFEDELCHFLTALLGAESEQHEEQRRLKETMADLGVVGVSQAMIKVFRTIVRVSVLSDLPTLLVGETGTGKELLAHAIHALDPKRRKGPFIALNCAALAPTLAESELFGHRRGAFTGAERNRRGLIRAAHNGVLFLDEIGELDLSLQAKLLRVLQESRVLSIGDDQELPISVRVVAATNRELGELVKEGRFRSDLFHRLNVVSVHTPALRERPEDIRPLAHSFVAKYSSPGQKDGFTVAPDFIEALAQVELPGNVRQLENVVRQALVNKTDTDRSLTLSDLPMEIWQQVCERKVVPNTTERGSIAKSPVPDEFRFGMEKQWEELFETHRGNLARCLAFCERALVATALRRTQGNQSQAARLLGISPRTIYNKLHERETQW